MKVGMDPPRRPVDEPNLVYRSFVRGILSSSLVSLVLASAACSSDPAEVVTPEATSSDASSSTLTTEAAEFTGDDSPPREGSVADLDNPIQILEDGMTFDPQWRADITLTCGPDPDSRTIAMSDINTNDRGRPALYQQTPSNGGFAAEPATVGSIVPIDVDLAWSIPGILLGPWRVDSITDACSNEQANGLIPFTTIAVEQRAGAPYSTDIATTQAEVDLLMAERGIDPIVLDPRTAVLSFVFAESSSPQCAYGPLAGLRLSAEDQSVSPILGPSPAALLPPDTEVACNDDANPYGFLLVVNLDDLPSSEFWLSLVQERQRLGSPFSYTTRVDSARASSGPFGDTAILDANGELGVGESGIALHVPMLCGRDVLYFDIDGLQWELLDGSYDMSESWQAASSGNERLNLTLERTSNDEILAIPVNGGDAVVFYRVSEAPFTPCDF